MNKQEIEKDIEILTYYEAQDYFFSKDMSALHAFRRAIKALEQQLNNGWIPVSERLPEEYLCKDREYDPSEYVLVQLDNGYMKTSRYWNHRHCKDTIIEQPWLDLKTWENVTAWQHLPEKYKEVSE